MDSLPFGRSGHFYRGNLHTHSTNSDGDFPPDEVVRRYREAGYDFVALSEHFMPQYDYRISDTRPFRSEDFTTIIAAELHQGKTLVDERWHALAVGIPHDFAAPENGETQAEITRRAADTGAFIGIVHPSWYGLSLEDARAIESAHAIEIYNHGSHVEVDRGEDWPFCEQLLNSGWRLNAFATDDAHRLTHDWLGGWVNVHAESLDPGELVESLKAGRFYSSQGPEIHDVQLDGDKVHISCSPAATISAQGRGSKSRHEEGDGLTQAMFEVTRFKDAYMRITVRDAEGRRAWTNPIWFQ